MTPWKSNGQPYMDEDEEAPFGGPVMTPGEDQEFEFWRGVPRWWRYTPMDGRVRLIHPHGRSYVTPACPFCRGGLMQRTPYRWECSECGQMFRQSGSMLNSEPLCEEPGRRPWGWESLRLWVSSKLER